MKEKLKQLGLRPNEIKVYTTLLDLGQSTVGPMVKKTGMHRQLVYDALFNLEAKDMVLKTTKSNRFYFSVADPVSLVNHVKQQELLARSVAQEVNEKLVGQKKGQEIKIYEGEKAFRDLTKRNDDLQPPNSEYLVVTGVGINFKKIMQKSKVFQRSNRIRKKKNIKTKLIYCNVSKKGHSTMGRANAEARFLDKGYDSPTAFAVWHDSVNLISYGSSVFCIEIKNDDFLKAYKNYFNFLWSVAAKK